MGWASADFPALFPCLSSTQCPALLLLTHSSQVLGSLAAGQTLSFLGLPLNEQAHSAVGGWLGVPEVEVGTHCAPQIPECL